MLESSSSSSSITSPLLTPSKSPSLLSLSKGRNYGSTSRFDDYSSTPSSSSSSPFSSSVPSNPYPTSSPPYISFHFLPTLNEEDEKWVAAERMYEWGKSILKSYEDDYPENFFTSPMAKNKWILAAQIGVVFAYILVAINAIYTIVELVTNPQAEIHVMFWAIASIFVSVAVPLSLHDIYLHMLHYVNPLQRYYLRILLMVPIYAIESWLALRFKEQRVYLETAREAYEAFVVFSFTKLMMDFLGSRRTIIAKLQAGPFEASGMNAIDTSKDIRNSNQSSSIHQMNESSSSLTRSSYPLSSPNRTGNGTNKFSSLSQPKKDDNTETGDVVTYHLAASNENEVDDSVLVAEEQDDDTNNHTTNSSRSTTTVTILKNDGTTHYNVNGNKSLSTKKEPTKGTETISISMDTSSLPPIASPSSPSFSSSSSHHTSSWKSTFLLYVCGIAKHRPRDGYAIMLPPFCCLRRWRLGSHFLRNISFGVLQYVVLRSVLGIVTAILESLDQYDNGNFSSVQSGYLWNVIILNISQTWALYCLALFAFHLWDYLTPMKPLGKFLVVKWVIFLSWWQGLVISILSANEVLPSIPFYNTDETAAGLQDFLICIEMAFAAYIHHKHFSYLDFKNPYMTSALIDSAYASGDNQQHQRTLSSENTHQENGSRRISGSSLPLPEESTYQRSSLSLFSGDDDEDDDTNDTRKNQAKNSNTVISSSSSLPHSVSRKNTTKTSSTRANSSNNTLEKEIDAALEYETRSSPSSRSGLHNPTKKSTTATVRQMQVQNDGQLRDISRSTNNNNMVLTAVKDILPTDVIADTVEHVLSTTSYLKEKTNHIVHATRNAIQKNKTGNNTEGGGNNSSTLSINHGTGSSTS